MKPKTATHHRRWVLRLFEWAVLVCVIQLLAGIFLQRVDRMQADAERLAFRGVIDSLKAAAIFASLTQHGPLEGGNPIYLLAQPPLNYAGEVEGLLLDDLLEGHWYFDKSRQLLIYRCRRYQRAESGLGPQKLQQISLKKEKIAGQMRYRLVVVPGGA